MANINFSQINSSSNDSNFAVGYFSLKDDGDEAVVRIMHDSIDSFDLVTTHPIQLNGKYPKINCLRNPTDPMNYCPLCEVGEKIQQRFYIHLIQYTKDENGNIISQPKVWERSASYATTIKNLIDEYGPLSNCIFKIRRSGAKGSMDTKYSIMYGNPQVYREEMYPKNNEVFSNYHAVGNVVMDKSFEEVSEFVHTGSFPDNKKTVDNSSSVNNDVQNNQVPQYNVNQNNPYQVPNHTGVPYTPEMNYTTQNNQQVQRPTRYY